MVTYQFYLILKKNLAINYSKINKNLQNLD